MLIGDSFFAKVFSDTGVQVFEVRHGDQVHAVCSLSFWWTNAHGL